MGPLLHHEVVGMVRGTPSTASVAFFRVRVYADGVCVCLEASPISRQGRTAGVSMVIEEPPDQNLTLGARTLVTTNRWQC